MMDVDWPQYILRAITSVLAIYGFVYMASAIGWPTFFLSNMALNRTDFRTSSGRHPRWMWPLAIFTALSVGVVIYAALYPTIAAIPFSWGSHDEDGEWTSTRNYLQITGALFATIGVISTLERVAEVLIWGPVERTARDALTDAIAYNRTAGEEICKAAERNLRKELGPQEYEIKNAATGWRDDLREAIVRRLTR